MTGVFRKLIRKEFGDRKYNIYFATVHKNIENRALDCKDLYNDIYACCKDKDMKAIVKMHDRLNDAMLSVLRISRTYLFAMIFYFAALTFLLLQGLNGAVTFIAASLMTLCSLLKTWEFIVNKYCYVDAQIVVIYKAVLESILLGGKNTDISG